MQGLSRLMETNSFGYIALYEGDMQRMEKKEYIYIYIYHIFVEHIYI